MSKNRRNRIREAIKANLAADGHALSRDQQRHRAPVSRDSTPQYSLNRKEVSPE